MTINIPVDFAQEIAKIVTDSVESLLKEIGGVKSPKAYMNTAEACEYMNISYPTFRKLESRGLSSIRIESKKLFRRETIDLFYKGLEN